MTNFFEFWQRLDESMRPAGLPQQYAGKTPYQAGVAPDTHTGRATTKLDKRLSEPEQDALKQGRDADKAINQNKWDDAVAQNPALNAYSQASSAMSQDRKANKMDTSGFAKSERQGAQVKTGQMPHRVALMDLANDGNQFASLALKIEQLVQDHPDKFNGAVPFDDAVIEFTKLIPTGNNDNEIEHMINIRKGLATLIQNGKSVGYRYDAKTKSVIFPKGGEHVSNDITDKWASNRGPQHTESELAERSRKFVSVVNMLHDQGASHDEIFSKPEVQQAAKDLLHVADLATHDPVDHKVDFMGEPATAAEIKDTMNTILSDYGPSKV